MLRGGAARAIRLAVSRRMLANRIEKGAIYANAPLPALSVDAIPVDAVVGRLADQICGLDMLQASMLATVLKKRLNLPDAPALLGYSAGPLQGAAASASAAPAAPEKTEFSLTLEKIDAASKAKVIREIKTILPQLNLVEAKAFVEAAPKLVKEKMKKDDAEKLKAALEAAGATVSLA